MLQVTDSFGRDVRELGICATCGASIKYQYPYNGKVYGSTCIEKVCGIAPSEWEWENYKPSFEATLAKKAKKQAYENKVAENNAKREQIRKINSKKFSEVIEMLKNKSRYEGDFCWGMASQIENAGYSNNLWSEEDANCIFTWRQFEVIAEIYAKDFGRKNSKAFKQAFNSFVEKWSIIE